MKNYLFLVLLLCLASCTTNPSSPVSSESSTTATIKNIFNDPPGLPKEIIGPNEPPVISKEKLVTYTNEFNKTLPQQIDKDTVMNTVVPEDNGTVIYAMQLPNVKSTSMPPERLANTQFVLAQLLKKRTCNSSFSKNLFTQGVKNLIFVYTDADSVEVVNELIILRHCYVAPQYVELAPATEEQMNLLNTRLEQFFTARNKKSNNRQLAVTHKDREMLVTVSLGKTTGDLDQIADSQKIKATYLAEICQNNEIVKILQHAISLHFLVQADEQTNLADFSFNIHDCETMF